MDMPGFETCRNVPAVLCRLLRVLSLFMWQVQPKPKRKSQLAVNTYVWSLRLNCWLCAPGIESLMKD